MRLKASFSAIAVIAVLAVAELEFDRLLAPRGHSEGARPGQGHGDSDGKAVAVAHAKCVSGARLVEHYRYYDFFGAGAADANRSFRQRLLVSQDFAGRTKRFAGQADWHIEWRACLEPFGMACRIAGIASSVHVTYTLPRWVDRAVARGGLGTRWDSYATNLLAHERGHGRIALEVAHMIEREATGVVSPGGCDAATSQASEIVAQAMRRGEAMQNEYDQVTGHGSRQGAQFPF